MKKCLLVLAIISGIISCRKNTVESGQFMIVNASPGFGPATIQIDANPFGTAAVAYSGNTGYLPLLQGRHLLQAVVGGTPVFDVNFTSAGLQNQTLFIYDRPTSLQVFAVVDNIASPGSGKAGLRFFHLSPGSPLVDVGTLSGATFTPLFTARSFETASTAFTGSGFTTLNSGTYSVQVRVTGAGTELLTVNNIQLQEGKNYTVFLKGISGNATTPLGLELIGNN